MREILFRGKRVDNGEWVEGSLLDYKPHYKWTAIYCLCDNDDGMLEMYRHDVNPSTVGQYTGLKDKNGKRIFEGDVIKIEHSDYAFDGMSLGYRTEQGMVAYDSMGMIGIVVEKYKGENVWSDFFHVLGLTDRIEDWYFEVIGNIHDNPELLEVKHDER